MSPTKLFVHPAQMQTRGRLAASLVFIVTVFDFTDKVLSTRRAPQRHSLHGRYESMADRHQGKQKSRCGYSGFPGIRSPYAASRSPMPKGFATISFVSSVVIRTSPN